MAEDFISDADMAKHVASGAAKAASPPDFISDDDMDAYHKSQNHGAAQAGLEHFGNAAAQGYLPHLQAMAEPITDRIFNAATGGNVEPAPLKQALAMGPGYIQARDANIARLAQQKKDFPTPSLIGDLSGTAAGAAPIGAGIMKAPGMSALAGMKAAEGAGLAARGAALAGRTAGAALGAGAQGLINNPGDTPGEENPLQLGDRLKGGALSASIAAPLHMGAEGISAVGNSLAPKLEEGANKLAYRALGPFKRQVNQTGDNAQEIGREALDSGVVRWMPTNAEGIEERASEAAGKAGKNLGDITNELIGLEGQAKSSGMSRQQIADNLRKKLISENPQGIPGLDTRNQTFQNMISDFEKDPAIKKLAMQHGIPYEDAQKLAAASGYQPKPFAFSDLRQAKMNVQGTKGQDGLINWNRLKNADIPIDEQFHRALAGELRQGEESGADAIEKAYYGDSSNRFQDAKAKFGNLQTAAEIAGNRADSQRANHILGLRDSILAAGGASAGGAIAGGAAGALTGNQDDAVKAAKIGALIGGGGSYLSRNYGSQVGAKMSDAMSKLLSQSPQLQSVIQKYPNVLPQLIQSLQKPNDRASGAGTQSGQSAVTENHPSNGYQAKPNELPMEMDQARDMFRKGN